MIEMKELKAQFKTEADSILNYWLGMIDNIHGGFYCFCDADNNISYQNDKSVLLHSRILWTFSKAYRVFGDERYREAAEHCFLFIRDHCIDEIHGGVYWMLKYDGNLIDDQKHVYNQCFAIYALSEFFLSTDNEESLNLALDLFNIVEKFAYDSKNCGYNEAFNCSWEPIPNYLVCDTSEGVLAEKSMNTHLHILEAYTSLYKATNSLMIQHKLLELLKIIRWNIIDSSGHFGLFFSSDWKCVSKDVSYGHDIEGSWLMDEAAKELSDGDFANEIFQFTTRMADITLSEGVDRNGAVFNELREGYLLDTDRVWWVQAEAMVGFYNAYQKTRRHDYFQAFLACWNIAKNQLKDTVHGEWHWKLRRNGEPYSDLPKVEPWKCPYHNGRACLELYTRLEIDELSSYEVAPQPTLFTN
ncbi:N-acylglucosamine 2-epimerase [Vibrio sp. SM6]|uniref:Cellobiose 2-epimerase n=1 Tax=Vibrio agarilyticus TaxID=2726741 RepID=A0A7X8TUP8_9VIBR|nr:AGE family epimerase/isomerase [Vibrio agarilyticus]NLS14882.1 N-acylglucosamine 2-epimerase [Vibrio agarilyticus]